MLYLKVNSRQLVFYFDKYSFMMYVLVSFRSRRVSIIIIRTNNQSRSLPSNQVSKASGSAIGKWYIVTTQFVWKVLSWL